MKAGQKFSFEELQSAIADYERTVYAKFWISNLQTVHAARKASHAPLTRTWPTQPSVSMAEERTNPCRQVLVLKNISYWLLCIFISLYWPYTNHEIMALGGDGGTAKKKKKASSAFLNDTCSLAEIKPYFEDDACPSVVSIVEMKKRKPVWFCPTCKKLIGKADSVCCDSCLEWRHLKWICLNGLPKSSTWFCRECYQ